MTRRIAQEDLADSVVAALQFISHHHPPDFVRALRRAHDAETHAPAKAAMAQILINSRLAASGRRPIWYWMPMGLPSLSSFKSISGIFTSAG